MYFNAVFIEKVFSVLQNICETDSSTIRQIKVSQLRHLLAISILIKQESLQDGKVDLTPTVGLHRRLFKKAVGELVRLNDSGLFTQDFKNEFETANDYKVSSNFLTTLVRWSGPYPGQTSGRDGPVINVEKIGDRNFASIHAEFSESLEADYNLGKIRVALAFWICRFVEFKSTANSVKGLTTAVNTHIAEIFEDRLTPYLKVDANECREFLGISESATTEEIFSQMPTNLAFLAPGTDTEHQAYNVIFSGPPGTGKTRCARILAALIANGSNIPEDLSELQDMPYPEKDSELEKNIFSAQFHPSYSYEDFIEGLKPVGIKQSGKSDVAYEVVPGIFKASVEIARSLSESDFEIVFNTAYSTSTSWQLSSNATLSLYRIGKRSGSLFFEGKEICSFEAGSKDPMRISLEIVPSGEGNYKLTWKAKEASNENVVLIIDEFNRGDPAVIFGEALSLLEKTKRVGQNEAIEIMLPYSGSSFMIPSNFHVLATMNTSDRALSAIDLALKRRFRFVYLKPNFKLLASLKAKSSAQEKQLIDEVILHFDSLNQALQDAGVSVDQQIGHSYAFMLLGSVKKQTKIDTTGQWQKTYISCLNLLWKFELHQIVRDIVGSVKAEKFSKHFVMKIQNGTTIEPLKGFMQEKFSKFLEDPSADENWLRVS